MYPKEGPGHGPCLQPGLAATFLLFLLSFLPSSWVSLSMEVAGQHLSQRVRLRVLSPPMASGARVEVVSGSLLGSSEAAPALGDPGVQRLPGQERDP